MSGKAKGGDASGSAGWFFVVLAAGAPHRVARAVDSVAACGGGSTAHVGERGVVPSCTSRPGERGFSLRGHPRPRVPSGLWSLCELRCVSGPARSRRREREDIHAC
eukprot:914183-Prymnesium_polylepis.1